MGYRLNVYTAGKITNFFDESTYVTYCMYCDLNSTYQKKNFNNNNKPQDSSLHFRIFKNAANADFLINNIKRGTIVSIAGLLFIKGSSFEIEFPQVTILSQADNLEGHSSSNSSSIDSKKSTFSKEEVEREKVEKIEESVDSSEDYEEEDQF